jgi:hypothetical protein
MVGMAKLQRERNGALFGVHGLVRSKMLDNAGIVRDACLQQRYCGRRSGLAGKVPACPE